MLRASCWVIVLFSLGACSKAAQDTSAADKARLMATSFEEMDGWVAPSSSLTTEKAHTGQYAVKVDPTMEFSLTFAKELSRLSPERVNKVRLTGWTFATEPGEKAALVFQVAQPTGQTVFYEKIDLDQVGKWSQLSKSFALPPVLDPASKVSVYLWRNKASGAVYLDDVALTVEP